MKTDKEIRIGVICNRSTICKAYIFIGASGQNNFYIVILQNSFQLPCNRKVNILFYCLAADSTSVNSSMPRIHDNTKPQGIILCWSNRGSIVACVSICVYIRVFIYLFIFLCKSLVYVKTSANHKYHHYNRYQYDDRPQQIRNHKPLNLSLPDSFPLSVLFPVHCRICSSIWNKSIPPRESMAFW